MKMPHRNQSPSRARTYPLLPVVGKHPPRRWTTNEWKKTLREYDQLHRPKHLEGLSWFAEQPSLAAAVAYAATATNRCQKRFDHQRRIRKQAIQSAKAVLPRHCRQFAEATPFGEIHQIVLKSVGGIPGIGELFCYDTALRIASFRLLEPEEVYLHAGAREGARAFCDLTYDTQSLPANQFPEPLRSRPPHEIENIL